MLNAVVSPVITRHFSEGEKKVSQAFLDLEDLALCSPQPAGLPSRHGADLLLTHQAPRLRLPLTPASSPQGQAPGTVPKHILSDGEELWWANRTNPAAAHCALLPCPHQHVSLPSRTHPSAPPWWLRRLAVLGTIGRAGWGGMHGHSPSRIRMETSRYIFVRISWPSSGNPPVRSSPTPQGSTHAALRSHRSSALKNKAFIFCG